jgi:hypothetical protein
MRKKMKEIIFLIGFLLAMFTSFAEAQPYLYFTNQFTDTLYGEEHLFEKIQRFNLTANLVEDFPPQQFASDEIFVTTDPSCIYLAIGSIVNNFVSYLLYDSRDTSNYFVLQEDMGGLDELLYSSQRNNLYLFANDYGIISVLDLSVKEIIYTHSIDNIAYNNSLLYPPHSSFFSSDSNKIYFFSRDTLSEPYQISTYSLILNDIIQKQDLSDFGYEGTDGYDLTFGRNGKGIISSYPDHNNAVKDFYYRIYDFDNDSGSPFIYHDGLSEAYFSGDGEFLIVMDTEIDDSLRYSHTGDIEIFYTPNAELLKTLTLPSGGMVYTFDNYPNNIYYVIDIEESTRQIYTLKMDSIFNVLDLTSLNPSSAVVNSSPFTLTVYGQGFDTLSTVYFNDTEKTTTLISDSVLTAEISTSDISVVGNYPVWVTDQWGTSDTLIFTVVPQPPVLTSISPAIALRVFSVGTPPSAIAATATGDFFTDSSVVYFNGSVKTTNFVSETELTFQLSGSEVSTSGNYPVWVSNYGSNSDTLTFSVVDNLPQTLTPTLQCVRNIGDDSYWAYFGYNNNNSVSVYVPVGSKNKFAPTPIDRGQPKLFLPGNHTNVLIVVFNGKNLTWTLDQTSVTANKLSTPCP